MILFGGLIFVFVVKIETTSLTICYDEKTVRFAGMTAAHERKGF